MLAGGPALNRHFGSISSKGSHLCRYERNIMIFDWLHTLDETATAAVEAANAATEKETEEK